MLHIRNVFSYCNPLDPPISTEHCDWLYGIFGHETSCTRYWTCWNGTATEQFCIGGLLYNEETHACDWPQNVGGCQKHRKLLLFSVYINSCICGVRVRPGGSILKMVGPGHTFYSISTKKVGGPGPSTPDRSCSTSVTNKTIWLKH